MHFKVAKEFFELFPTACFGVVVAKGVNNNQSTEEIKQLLLQSIAEREETFSKVKVKEHPAILIWREAFQKLGYNPNKFPSSIEAMSSRVAKGGKLPLINDIVNLTNALSLKYLLPMGAHDLENMKGDIELTFTDGNYPFTPFGMEEAEPVEPGELVYRDSLEVRTRKWVWRQGNKAKITQESQTIFFPIDGFSDFNLQNVLEARNELAELLQRYFVVEVKCFLIDQDNLEALLL